MKLLLLTKTMMITWKMVSVADMTMMMLLGRCESTKDIIIIIILGAVFTIVNMIDNLRHRLHHHDHHHVMMGIVITCFYAHEHAG